MKLVTERVGAIDLATTPIHLGLGSKAMPIDGFAWDPAVLEEYSRATEADGGDGRAVFLFDAVGSWDHWECHPAGDEVVICLSGSFTVIREIDGQEDPVLLHAGNAMVNPAGVWHTADVHEPGRFMSITPGQGTEHRPR